MRRKNLRRKKRGGSRAPVLYVLVLEKKKRKKELTGRDGEKPPKGEETSEKQYRPKPRPMDKARGGDLAHEHGEEGRVRIFCTSKKRKRVGRGRGLQQPCGFGGKQMERWTPTPSLHEK